MLVNVWRHASDGTRTTSVGVGCCICAYLVCATWVGECRELVSGVLGG